MGTAHPLIGVGAAFESYPGSPLVFGIPGIILLLLYTPNSITVIEWWWLSG